MEHIGKQVKVILKDGSQYEGFVHSMNTHTGKLTLHKVTNEDGKKLQGIQHFFNNELQNIYAFEKELPSSSKNEEEKLVDKKETGRKMIHSKYVPAHLQRMRDFNRNSVLLSNIASNGVDNTVKQDNKSSDYDSSSDPETLEGGTDAPYVVINKMDRKYQDAIDAVLNCAVVGLAMQGVCIGRSGEVCWVQFATDKNVFLFDVLELSANCFEEGIKDILENPDILKVTHDCRLMSDYLFHCHNIKLVNVFDTQVADVFVDRVFKGGDWPRYVKGLADCALNNLDLEPEQVFNLKTREKIKKSDEEIWATRPISRPLLDALFKNVVHLRPLRQVLIEKMMAEYVAGVDVYLSQVRDSSMKDAKMHQANLLPMAFQGLRKLMPHYHSYQWSNRRQDTETSNVKGFTDNILPIRDPKVIISHDSIWHQGPYQGQHMFKQVASHLKFVNEDGTPVNVENHKKESTPEKIESQRSVNSSSSSTITPHISPVKKMQQKQSENNTAEVPVLNGEAKRSPASPMKGLSHLKEVLEMQKAMKESESEEVSTGTLIRSVLKQTDPKKLEHKEEDDEAYAFRPAGVMVHAKKNDKTTMRRQREIDELELEMAQYVMDNQNVENSQHEELDYDDWGGTRRNLVIDSQEKRDTFLKKFLAMAAKENAIKQSNYDLQQNTVQTPTSHGDSNILQSFAAVRSPSSVASDTQGNLTSPQQYMQNYLTKHENSVSNDNESVQGSGTLTQGSIASSHQRSTNTGHLTQHRCLYRGQISKAKSPSPSQSGGSVLNTSLPSSSEPPISNQSHRSVSLPATPVSTSEKSCENLQQNGSKVVLNGTSPSIANLSKLASIIAKSSMRSTSSADKEHSKDLTNSSVSSTPRKPTNSVQEAFFTNRILSSVHSNSSRSTTSVQKSSNNDSSNASSTCMNENTQEKSPGSVSAALSSTNSKIQRLKILAEAMKKPD
ncbi:uncharacterized protein LOC133191860 [Saccostrea echinata]|uniref:uncharacterized protein LOC133191860 n=1 Tax=Saccostrea echinata TaxID=191078 RepID=UPI002A8255F2|nr:uncharacterized protein LOC133191860 [Saccostrea echinata]